MKSALSMLAIILVLYPFQLFAADPGKETIGKLRVEMIYASNQGLEKIGDRGRELSSADLKAIRAFDELRFKDYRSIGVEEPDVLRGYETWATPMRPSKEMLMSFEPLNRAGDGKLQMVLEYWQSKRKLFRTNPTLVVGKPLYLLGPDWRGGRVILKLELTQLTAS